jgi:hypothetical protein
MSEAALYILTGLTLYAGGHYLYLGAVRGDTDWPQLQFGGLYWLLAAFAMTSGMTYQSTDLAVLLPTGKLEISFGILLWLAVLWYVAFRSGVKPLIVLDLLTAVWLIFLVRNLIEPNSLLYADVTPVNQSLMSGQTLDLYFANISPWWTAVELAMLASLLFCYYAGYRLYREGRREAALILLAGGVLLGLVTLHDHLVTTMLIEAPYLAPFGFLLFLLPASLYPLWQNWRTRHSAPLAPVVYNLAYMPDQASFHTDVSQLRTPLRPDTRVTRVASGQDNAGDAISTLDRPPRQARPAVRAVEMPVETPVKKAQPAAPAAQADAATVTAVTDSLIDIAVFATMALNRFKRGDADPQTLESLCRKIRTQAIKTRRLTHKLLPEDLQDND